MDKVIILSQTATNKEYDWILSLRRHLQADLCELLVDDYKAVAIHSNSIVIAANECCAQMFGYTVDEVIGLNAWTLPAIFGGFNVRQRRLMKNWIVGALSPCCGIDR